MKKILLIFLILFAIVSFKSKNDNEKSDLAHNIEILNQTKYDKLDLYHNAMMIHIYNEKGSVDYLKKNNINLYHHAKIFIGGKEAEPSLEYLKINDINLYHNVLMILGDETSMEFLKKNNIDLYHHGLMIHENEDSADYLKKHNIDLYHHAMLIFGNESPLNYFEN